MRPDGLDRGSLAGAFQDAPDDDVLSQGAPLASLAMGGLPPAFRTNRSCRQGRAHQGMKVVVRRALQLARTSGPSQAGDKLQRYNPLSPPLWIPAFAGITMALRGPHKRMKIAGCRVGFSIVWWVYPSPPLDSGFRRSDESGVYFHSNRSCRAAAGTPRYEKPELWLGTADWHGGFCHAPRRPQRGTSPRATFSHSAIGHRYTIRHVSPVESRHRG